MVEGVRDRERERVQDFSCCVNTGSPGKRLRNATFTIKYSKALKACESFASSLHAPPLANSLQNIEHRDKVSERL